jgi:hypothetical protein
MKQEARDRAEALRLVLSRHQMIPPSSDEIYQAIDEVLPYIRAIRRGVLPREDQTSIL